MLAVIMVFAIAGAGQPQLRVIGSAFDPSTTAVSLSPKQRSLGEKTAVLRSDLPEVEAGNSPDVAVAAYAVVTPVPVLSARIWQPASRLIAHARYSSKPVGARAPPRH
jgi:hypothetical protein